MEIEGVPYHTTNDPLAELLGYELDETTGEWKPVVIVVRFGMPITSRERSEPPR